MADHKSRSAQDEPAFGLRTCVFPDFSPWFRIFRSQVAHWGDLLVPSSIGAQRSIPCHACHETHRTAVARNGAGNAIDLTQLLTVGGEARIDTLRIYTMQSIWREDCE